MLLDTRCAPGVCDLICVMTLAALVLTCASFLLLSKAVVGFTFKCAGLMCMIYRSTSVPNFCVREFLTGGRYLRLTDDVGRRPESLEED